MCTWHRTIETRRVIKAAEWTFGLAEGQDSSSREFCRGMECDKFGQVEVMLLHAVVQNALHVRAVQLPLDHHGEEARVKHRDVFAFPEVGDEQVKLGDKHRW